jgi:hypothetical protein
MPLSYSVSIVLDKKSYMETISKRGAIANSVSQSGLVGTTMSKVTGSASNMGVV